jgi:hypothetical protein
VDLVDGRLRSAITVPIGEDTPRAADVVEGIGGSLAPPAAAPLFTEPALAQSRDGARLYAVGLDISAGRPAPAMAGTYVFDTATEEVLARWTLDRDISSIRLSADGSTLLAALMPVAAADGRLDREATIAGLDAQTGELRLVAGRLGAHPLLFLPDP